MRPIIFVKYYDKVSTILAADQLSQALRDRGLDGRSIHAHDLPGVTDSVLIFIKTSKLPHLWRARRAGNTLILDVHDTLVFKRRIKNRPLFHGIIFRNRRQHRDFARTPDVLIPHDVSHTRDVSLTGDVSHTRDAAHTHNASRTRAASRRRADTTIYLHWDPRFRPNEIGDAEFKVGYLGDPRSFALWDQLPGVPCIGQDDLFNAARRLNCHLSIRTTPREMRYKPSIKVVTAAACDAVLITTRDDSALELLGPDYPYYTDPDRHSVLRAIDHARHTFNTPLWHTALQTLRRLKPAHTIDAELDHYLEYLRRFETHHDAEPTQP